MIPKGSVDTGGLLGGHINVVRVSMDGAMIFFAQDADQGTVVNLNLWLYRDSPSLAPTLPRVEWMRRGAVLSLAQRALTNHHYVSLEVDPLDHDYITSIAISLDKTS